MPELTSQDRESYQKLYKAATGLSAKISFNQVESKKLKISDSFTLEELTKAFSEKLSKPEDLYSFEQLQAKVELTGGYLTMYQLFADVISTSSVKDGINQASQELRTQYNQLKVSLEAVDDDFLDNVTRPSSDPLFLRLLTDRTDTKIKEWTQQLISDQAPALTDSEVEKLINAWGTVVTEFVEDARKENEDGSRVNPGQSTTIAHFFCIHEQLEGLYSELSTSVALNS
ncbi:MAG TPA: hypothetical protein V6D18_07380 [Thermosynechococcaceae cyanobacterium]|jgi:hypothetical protein